MPILVMPFHPSMQTKAPPAPAFASPLHLVPRRSRPASTCRQRRPPSCCAAPRPPSPPPPPPPSSQPDDYVLVRVFAVGPPDPPSSATLLTLLPVCPKATCTPQGKLAFRMAVSDHQASAIRDVVIAQSSGAPNARRPTTHALLLSALGACSASVSEAAITDVAGDVFVASLHLDAKDVGGRRPLDARPSDAIALAALVGAPLYLRRELLDRWPVSLGSVEADIRAGLCERLPPFGGELHGVGGDLDGDEAGLAAGDGTQNLLNDRNLNGVPPSTPVWVSAASAASARRDTSNPASRRSNSSPPRTSSSGVSSTNHPPTKSAKTEPSMNPAPSVANCRTQRHPTLARLETLSARLDVAVRLERFHEAAELRDEIERICPIQRMQNELEQACLDQDFTKAAMLRDQMAEWEATLERWDTEGVCEGVDIIVDAVDSDDVVVPPTVDAGFDDKISEMAASAFALGVDIGLAPDAAAGITVDDEDDDFFLNESEQNLNWTMSSEGAECWTNGTPDGDADKENSEKSDSYFSERSPRPGGEDVPPNGSCTSDDADDGIPSDNV